MEGWIKGEIEGRIDGEIYGRVKIRDEDEGWGWIERMAGGGGSFGIRREK